MEILIKVTDLQQPADLSKEAAMLAALEEAKAVLDTDAKKIATLVHKGRKKIDLVGIGCNLELSMKD
jgi:superfamily I DNA and RNA helicase